MNTLSKILLAIYAVILAAASLCMMVITIWPGVFKKLTSLFTFSVLDNRNTSFILFLVALILFSLSIVFLFTTFGQRRIGKVIVKKSDMGEMVISLDAIENICLYTVKRIPSVRECRALCNRIKDNEKVAITIRVIVLSDTNMPSLSDEVQKKVAKAVEDSTGVEVQSIKVLIDNIYSVMKARVE